MERGGPDDEGVFQDGKVVFGHKRLSIIELSQDGHQPMIGYEGEITITFNGEIYNYRQLKQELEAVGCIFKTKTDTEVIIHSYRTWGKAAFDRFEGIFAFAIFDKVKNVIVLARDHVGVKPLYYSFLNGCFLFSSEVKAFNAYDRKWPENADWQVLFLAFGSMPFPHTTLKDVFILKPGCWMEVQIESLTYKTESFQRSATSNEDYVELKRLIKTKVQAALNKNLVADAEVGVFLSGGIDSSLLTLLASGQKNVKTISINFEQAQFDESKYQKMVLAKVDKPNHESDTVSEHMFWENLNDVWCAMDQPTIDGVNTYFVSRFAHRAGLKVVLSGLGADELFGGYASFKRVSLMKTLRTIIPFKNIISKVLGMYKSSYKRLTYLTLPGAVGDYLFLRGIHPPDVIASFLNISEDSVLNILSAQEINVPRNLTPYQYASFLEINEYMTNQLLRDSDVMGMWHALEIRVPFLDIDLIRSLNKIDVHQWEKQSYPKQFLVESFAGLLPEMVVTRRKQGFTFPLAIWLKNNKQALNALITHNTGSDKLLKSFYDGKSHWSACWSLAVAEQFGKH